MIDKDSTPRCHCTTCRGRAQIPAEYGRPPVYFHEVWQESKESNRARAPVPPTARIDVPVREYPRKTTGGTSAPLAKPPSYVYSDLPPEVVRKIEAIRARTDIGNGMKNMQISNITRKFAK